MSLLEKLKKNSTIKQTEVLKKSVFFGDKEYVDLNIPALNIAFSGKLNGGLVSGVTQFAAPSKHFKTAFILVCAAAYLRKYSDAVILFYDSEFGAPVSYFESFGIDTDRVIHTPITTVEQFKTDITNQLEGLERGDHIIILVDSIGNLASTKEIKDSLEGNSVSDMTRAKALKSLFRMITATLKVKDIPMIAINHTYKTLEMYSKTVVGGGTGSYYAADNIFIIGREQEKDGDELAGYNFKINVEKSRFVKEKSQIPITVTFEGGINKYSGLLEIAQELKFVVKPQKGYYSRVNPDTGETEDKKWREKETNTKEFWDMFLKSLVFEEAVENHFRLSTVDMIDTNENEGE